MLSFLASRWNLQHNHSIDWPSVSSSYQLWPRVVITEMSKKSITSNSRRPYGWEQDGRDERSDEGAGKKRTGLICIAPVQISSRFVARTTFFLCHGWLSPAFRGATLRPKEREGSPERVITRNASRYIPTRNVYFVKETTTIINLPAVTEIRAFLPWRSSRRIIDTR